MKTYAQGKMSPQGGHSFSHTETCKSADPKVLCMESKRIWKWMIPCAGQSCQAPFTLSSWTHALWPQESQHHSLIIV